MQLLRIAVLGLPVVTLDDRPMRLRGRQLALVTRLALADRAAVSATRLTEDLWSDGSGTSGALRVLLTRVRKVLGAEMILSGPAGYCLADHELDAREFEGLIRSSRDPNRPPTRRRDDLLAALGRWSGDAFEGFEHDAWAEFEARRLNELRDHAQDELFGLELELAHHDEVIPELRRALAQQPTRERRAELLAIALYRSGRQADALATIDRTRRVLREELGLEIGPGLRDLELKVLNHDPGLIAPCLAEDTDAMEIDGAVRAATALIRTGSFDEADAVIERAESLLQERGGRDEALVLLTRAQLWMLNGGGDPAPLIARARRIGRERRDGRLLARVAFVWFGAGVPDDKTSVLVEFVEPLELLDADAPARLDLLCAAAVFITFIDASDAAHRLVEAAREVHARFRSERSRCVLITAESLVAAVAGRLDEIVEVQAAESLQIARALDDPTLIVMASQVVLRVRYARGDLRGVDELLQPLAKASEQAMIPFGVNRTFLCRTTNALARGELAKVPGLIDDTVKSSRRANTHSAATGPLVHRLLLARERDELEPILEAARLAVVASAPQPTVWNAVLAIGGDEDAVHTLADIADEIPLDDSATVFTALAAEVAARHGISALGRWCAPRLDAHGSGTVVSGVGTTVLGFAAHFAGLAHVAIGDLDGARTRLERAIVLAETVGAWMWHAHSKVELAGVLLAARSGDDALAAQLLTEVRSSPVFHVSPRLARRASEVAGDATSQVAQTDQNLTAR